MEPTTLIVWAVCLGLGWLLFTSMTGADEWLRSLLGTSRTKEMEERIRKLESRLEEMEKPRST